MSVAGSLHDKYDGVHSTSRRWVWRMNKVHTKGLLKAQGSELGSVSFSVSSSGVLGVQGQRLAAVQTSNRRIVNVGLFLRLLCIAKDPSITLLAICICYERYLP